MFHILVLLILWMLIAMCVWLSWYHNDDYGCEHFYFISFSSFSCSESFICLYLSGSITVFFFAKEGDGCILISTKENQLAPVTVQFQQGLGQKFRQPAGTGIDFSMFEESDLLKVDDMDVYPLAVKADASPENQNGSNETATSGNTNSQITQAVFEKEKGEFRVKVVKQILSVNGMRYELQEIYGIGNSVESDLDDNDQGKECVICLSEPRDTIVHPCRHMVYAAYIFLMILMVVINTNMMINLGNTLFSLKLIIIFPFFSNTFGVRFLANLWLLCQI